MVEIQEAESILKKPQKILYTDSVAAGYQGLRCFNGLIFPDRITSPGRQYSPDRALKPDLMHALTAEYRCPAESIAVLLRKNSEWNSPPIQANPVMTNELFASY